MPKEITKNFPKLLHTALCAGLVLSLFMQSIAFAQEGSGEEEFPTWILPGFTPTDPDPEPEPDPTPSNNEVIFATEFTYTPPVLDQPVITLTPAYVTEPNPSNPQPEVILVPTPETQPQTTPTPEPTPNPEPVPPTPEPEAETESENNNFVIPSQPTQEESAESPDNNFVLPSAPKEEPKSNIRPSMFGNPQPPAKEEVTTFNSAPKEASNTTPENTLFAKPTPAEQPPAPEPEPQQVAPVPEAKPAPAPVVQKPVNTVRVSQYKSSERQSAGTTIRFQPKETTVQNNQPTLSYDTEKTHLMANRNIENQISDFLKSQRPRFLQVLGSMLLVLLIIGGGFYGYKRRRTIYYKIISNLQKIQRIIRKELYKFLHWLLHHHFAEFHHERHKNPVSFTKRRI